MDKDYDIRDQVKIVNKRGAKALVLGAPPQIAITNNRLSTINSEELEKLFKSQQDTAKTLREVFDRFFDVNTHGVPIIKAELLPGVKNTVNGLQFFYMANAMVDAINRAQSSLALTQRERDKRYRK